MDDKSTSEMVTRDHAYRVLLETGDVVVVRGRLR